MQLAMVDTAMVTSTSREDTSTTNMEEEVASSFELASMHQPLVTVEHSTSTIIDSSTKMTSSSHLVSLALISLFC